MSLVSREKQMGLYALVKDIANSTGCTSAEVKKVANETYAYGAGEVIESWALDKLCNEQADELFKVLANIWVDYYSPDFTLSTTSL